MSRNRSRCPKCRARSGWTKLDANGGKCPSCDFDMAGATFRKHARDMRLNVGTQTLDRMYEICKTHNVGITMLMDLALHSKLATWESDPNKFKQDAMLHKLSN